MRSSPSSRPLLSALLLLPTLASAISLNCEHIVVDSTRFNLLPLGGLHSVSWIVEEPPGRENTTFSIDICQPLRTEQCPSGTRVCAVTSTYNSGRYDPNFHIIPIAGEYTHSSGRSLDPQWTRLKGSPSNADREREGLRLEIGGGKWKEKNQRAIIEFICQRDADEAPSARLRTRQDENGGGEDGGDKDHEKEREEWERQKESADGDGGRLRFLSYQELEKESVLRLDWRTRRACEDAITEAPVPAKGGMGFFGWVFLLGFLGLAGYFLFFTWLNFRRYGARGWDLVPHSDFIRDIPWILSDWVRKVVDTIQGGGSRGGYTAV